MIHLLDFSNIQLHIDIYEPAQRRTKKGLRKWLHPAVQHYGATEELTERCSPQTSE